MENSPPGIQTIPGGAAIAGFPPRGMVGAKAAGGGPGRDPQAHTTSAPTLKVAIARAALAAVTALLYIAVGRREAV